MRPYEVMAIFEATTEPTIIQGVLDQALEVIRSTGGTPGAIDRWCTTPSAPTREATGGSSAGCGGTSARGPTSSGKTETQCEPSEPLPIPSAPGTRVVPSFFAAGGVARTLAAPATFGTLLSVDSQFWRSTTYKTWPSAVAIIRLR